MTFQFKKMTKDAVSGVLGTACKVIRRKPRKSLQTLQLSADEQEVIRPNMVFPKDKTTSKKKQSTAVEKVVSEKENVPSLRRSKRKVAVSDLLNYAESPDDPKTSKSVPVKPKAKKTAVKTKKGPATSVKKTNLNQTTLKFPPATPVETKTDPLEPAAPEKILTEASTSGMTEDSGFDPTSEVCEGSPIPCSNSSLQFAKCATSTPDNEASLITSASPTLYYWKELAEQRRVALEKALHENELIYDQLTVLEAENSQLKQLVREAESLASVVKGVLKSA